MQMKKNGADSSGPAWYSTERIRQMLSLHHIESETITQLDIPSSSGSAALRKKLRWAIECGEEHAVIWTITPELAGVMLEWNDRNRPQKSGAIKKYIGLMNDGKWMFTGQSVIFSTKRCLDGQHRLESCVKSGKAFKAVVVFGVPDEAFFHIDRGAIRTAADIFAINGVENSTLMAAAYRIVRMYESGWTAEAHGNIDVDLESFYEGFMAHPRLPESAHIGHLFHNSKLAPPGTMVALHYVCASKARGQADEFFELVSTGLGFSKTDNKHPAKRLRDMLEDNARSNEKMGRRQVAAVTIKAWNLYRQRRKAINKIPYEGGETFPKAQ